MTLYQKQDTKKRRSKVPDHPEGYDPAILDLMSPSLRKCFELQPSPAKPEFIMLHAKISGAVAIMAMGMLKQKSISFKEFNRILNATQKILLILSRGQRDMFGDAAKLGKVLVQREDKIQKFETDEEGNAIARDLTPEEQEELSVMLAEREEEMTGGEE